MFPFTSRVQRDPVSSREEGLAGAVDRQPPWPKVFFSNTGYEYWGRSASLIHTTVDGNTDVAPLPSERIYHFASTQHFVDRFPPQANASRFPANPVDFKLSLRALLVAMQAWVAAEVTPPASRYPSIAEGSLVAPESLEFPRIPGVAAPSQPHVGYRVDYGPDFWSQGIVSNQPPIIGKPFPARVSQVDADGNEIGGLRLPEVAVPLATYTPWNYRAAAIGAPNELADFRGATLAFPRTEQERSSRGDPRLSIAGRYASREDFLGQYVEYAVGLVRQRYLLAEDLPEMVEHAARLWDWAQSETAHGDLGE